MQFTTFALSALSIGSALAATTTTSSAFAIGTSTGQIVVHAVKVGNSNGSLSYSPNNIKANVGDMVQFQFAPNNHTVTQSTFAQPCQPISLNAPGTQGFYSGFMPVSATATTTPTYSIMINSTAPIWIYCSQGSHCQKGMVMVINEVATSNKTLSTFQALASQATVNLPGDATSVTGGTSSGGSGTGTTGGDSGSSTTSAGNTKSTTSGSSAVRASLMGGLVAVAAVLLL